MTANGNAPHQRVSPRARIRVLVSSGNWLYGIVNRAEFERAVADDENHTTFKLWKRDWDTGVTSVWTVLGSHVDAWHWKTPAAPARRKKGSKVGANGATLTTGQLADLVAETAGLNDNTVAMLSIAAGVDSIGALTQATLPAFREALAGYMAVHPIPHRSASRKEAKS
jgi:hypothetical protein